jgi:hypothetical protein
MGIIEKTNSKNADKDAQKKGLSSTVGGNVN